jgi:hypothetical protein
MYLICLQCREYKEMSELDSAACLRWVMQHKNHSLIFDDSLEWFNERERLLNIRDARIG